MTLANRWLALSGSLLLTATAFADDLQPHALLDRMNEAVRQLDYEGRFVVESADRMDAMYIVHRVDDGAEKERVVSLTGKPREIIRSDKAVACFVSGRKQHGNVGRRAGGRSFSPLQGVSAEQLKQFYRMEMRADARVAGRNAHQIMIEPLDDYRFGYRLYVDEETALPLRSMMIDDKQRVVSQMMFVDMKVNQDIAPIEQDVSAMALAQTDSMADEAEEDRLAPPAWQFGPLPPGFQLNLHRRPPAQEAHQQREHFVFSDGLASVSVYVLPGWDDGQLSGVSRLGSSRAVGRKIDGHEVVVVGEVPIKTLQWFLDDIKASQP